MFSEHIDLINISFDQATVILRLLDPDSENSALWAVQDLLSQAHDAANKLWEQGIANQRIMAETAA